MLTQFFDYSQLDSETRIVVQQRTSEIRTLLKRTAQDRIDIGVKLLDIKSRLNHGYWLNWLKVEFDGSEDTAENLMNAAKHFGQIPNSSEFQAKALYMLAAPSTPLEARTEAIERSAHEPITTQVAKQIVEKHKPQKQPAFITGQRVAVLDERSPYYGKEAIVLSSDGMALEAETDEGERIGLLAIEVQPQVKAESVQPPPPKINNFAVLQTELDIEHKRVEILEYELKRLIDAIDSNQPPATLKIMASEIKRLIE